MPVRQLGKNEHITGILEQLDDSARVLEVGGYGSRQSRADTVMDLFGFDASRIKPADRVTADQWIVHDVQRKPWPIKDKAFDFVICSHLLEDVMNPFPAIEELFRVARAGYIEVPERAFESSRRRFKGIPGCDHHRWLIEYEGETVFFTPKDSRLVYFRSLQTKPRDLEGNMIRLLWEEGDKPPKAVERLFTIDDAIAYRARLDGLENRTVRKQFAREFFHERVRYKLRRILKLD